MSRRLEKIIKTNYCLSLSYAIICFICYIGNFLFVLRCVSLANLNNNLSYTI